MTKPLPPTNLSLSIDNINKYSWLRPTWTLTHNAFYNPRPLTPDWHSFTSFWYLPYAREPEYEYDPEEYSDWLCDQDDDLTAEDYWLDDLNTYDYEVLSESDNEN